MKVSKSADRSRQNTWKIRWTADRKRRCVTWHGAEADAEKARKHIAELIRCGVDEPPHSSTQDWVRGLVDGEHAKLARAGLVVGREPDQPLPTLRMLYDSFLETKRTVQDSTKATYAQAWTVLSLRFGEDREVESITTIEAELFREWLLLEGNQREKKRTDLDRNTVGRRIGICRQIFRHGVKRKWVSENPFVGISATVSANPERFYYVSPGTMKRILDFCPDATMRAIVALNRLIGLRVPSEIRSLKWSDIDLSQHDPHLRVRAPKTEHHHKRGIRAAPILPSLRPYLQDIWDLAEPGHLVPMDSSVFPRFVDAGDSAIRSAALKIMKRAGVEPWPNLFSNCRKSAITDLLSQGYKVQDVASWMGNSSQVIWEYYAMASEDERRRAAAGGSAQVVHESDCGPICGPQSSDIPGHQEPSSPQNADKKKPARSPKIRENAGEWAMRDSNPRHSRCKRDALAN